MESFSDTESARMPLPAAGAPVYLDYNATTPVDPAVAAAMQPYIDTNFGNPSSGHAYGRATHDAVDTARGRWKSYGEDGHDLTYWRQTGAGGWEKKED